MRSVLEYTAPVWSPYLVKDVLALARVQRRASRLALGQKRGEIIWRTFKEAEVAHTRNTQTVSFFSRMIQDRIWYEQTKLWWSFEFTKCNSTRANHPYKLFLKPAKCNRPYKYFSLIWIVRHWNSLPSSVVEADPGAWVIIRVRWRAF